MLRTPPRGPQLLGEAAGGSGPGRPAGADPPPAPGPGPTGPDDGRPLGEAASEAGPDEAALGVVDADTEAPDGDRFPGRLPGDIPGVRRSRGEPAGASAGEPVGAAAADGTAPTEPVVHPRLWQRRAAVLREAGRRRLRFVVAGVALLVALCVGMLVLHTPLVAVRQVTVSGADHSGVQAIVAAAGLTGSPPLIDVDPAAAAARVEALPWVAHATVARRWPDAVSVTVTERVPIGAVLRPGGGAAVVDATGRVLAWDPSAPPGLVLSLPTAPGAPGTALAPADRPGVAVAAALPASVAGRVREVAVDGGQVRLDLGGGLSALLGSPDELSAKLAALASVLEEARPRGPAVIDLTLPDQPAVGPPTPAPKAPSGGR